MNLFNDAVRLASVGDGIALVLKANTSRRETAQRVVREARAANVRVLGAVLNQRTFPVPESIYKRL
jgi:Mrp family chromosome partitioning ATPase